jgi:hypothetical protein
MGSLVMGTSISWSGPALPLLELAPAMDGFSIDKTQASWVGSLMPLGKIMPSSWKHARSPVFQILNFFECKKVSLVWLSTKRMDPASFFFSQRSDADPMKRFRIPCVQFQAFLLA